MNCHGVAKVPGGWVSLWLTVQGDRVLSREVIGPVEKSEAWAWKAGELEVMKRRINPSGVKA